MDLKYLLIYLIKFSLLDAILCLIIGTTYIHTNSSIGQALEPIELNEENWSVILKGEWMVDFYASWCPACKTLKPEWQELAGWSEDLNIRVGWSDIADNPGLSGRFMISGLPTIYHIKDGIFRIYTGPRNHKSIIDFIEEKKWQQVVPISRWAEPNTIQMSLASHALQTSIKLRDLHNYLVDEIGLANYISYMLFGLCTVILGTIIGLFLGYLIDTVWTRSRDARPNNVTTDLKEKLDDLEKTTVDHDDTKNLPDTLTRRKTDNEQPQDEI